MVAASVMGFVDAVQRPHKKMELIMFSVFNLMGDVRKVFGVNFFALPVHKTVIGYAHMCTLYLEINACILAASFVSLSEEGLLVLHLLACKWL